MVTSISIIQLDQLAGFPKEFCIPLSNPSVLPFLDAAAGDDSQVSALFHAVMWQAVRMGPAFVRILRVRIGRHWSCERKLLGSAGTGTERSPGNGELVLGPSALSLEGVWSPG